jgi:hypothetical protein
MTLTRQCPGCLRVLPHAPPHYRQRSGRPTGQLTSRCGRCLTAYNTAWRLRHPDWARDYHAANPSRRLAYHLRQAEKLIKLLGSLPI